MSVKSFFTNKPDGETSPRPADAPIQAPALSLTKVGVAGGFILAVLSGLAGLIEPLNGANPAVATAVLDLAGKAVLFAALVAVADIAARALTAIFKKPPGGTATQLPPP